MPNIRKTGGRSEFDGFAAAIKALWWTNHNAARASGAIANGTTAGKLKTTKDITFALGGSLYFKATTDDLWTLSGLATLSTGQYRATALLLDSSGTASIASGAVAATAAAALAGLSASGVLDGTKAVIGVFVAGPSTNYANALSGQGTIYNGLPDGVFSGVPITMVAP